MRIFPFFRVDKYQFVCYNFIGKRVFDKGKLREIGGRKATGLKTGWVHACRLPKIPVYASRVAEKLEKRRQAGFFI